MHKGVRDRDDVRNGVLSEDGIRFVHDSLTTEVEARFSVDYMFNRNAKRL
jgi:hypothetical protein